jgi:hypothetical protein
MKSLCYFIHSEFNYEFNQTNDKIKKEKAILSESPHQNMII